MKITLSPDVAFTPQEYAGQGNAILGIRDSGKSYSATFFAEQLLNAGIPFVAFDPIGVWRFLKTPGHGPGYPVVVAGENGDLPLNVHSAPEIVRAAMRDNIPLVIDLYSMALSKADWRKIVASCVSILLYENKNFGLRHIFLEEAAEFCPQRVGPEMGVVYAVIEKLARMGGNASLGYTLINQRAEEVNKAVLENCDCLFLHRQKGKNSLMSLQKWIDFSGGGKTKEIVQALPGLAQGQCFAWLPGTDTPELVRMPSKRTFHPDRRKPELTLKANSGKADVTKFVGQLQKTLPRLAEEAAANDPKKLHARVKELEVELAKKNPIAFTISKEDRDSLIQQGMQKGLAAGAEQMKRWFLEEFDKFRKGLPAIFPAIGGNLVVKITREPVQLAQNAPHASKMHVPTARNAPIHRVQAEQNGGTPAKMDKCVRACLTVLAQHPEGVAKGELAVKAGYRQSGGFRNTLATMNVNGWATTAGDMRVLTALANRRKPYSWNKQAAQFKFMQCPECGWRGPYTDICPTPDCLTFGSEMLSVRPRVFCMSLGDWLDEEIPIEWTADLLKTVMDCPNLDWQLLTKRPENWSMRMEGVLKSIERPSGEEDIVLSMFVQRWLNEHPPTQILIGATMENQEMADERTPMLASIPAERRFISYEPALEGVRFNLDGIHWLITGGESGPGFREFSANWARSAMEQCEVAKVPFFMKQMGGYRGHGDLSDIPEDLRIRQFPQDLVGERIETKPSTERKIV